MQTVYAGALSGRKIIPQQMASPLTWTALYNAGDGYPSSFGEGGTDDPTRGEFNQVFKEITAVTTDVNKMRRHPRLALRDFLRTGCAREEVAEVLPLQDRHRESQQESSPVCELLVLDAGVHQ